MENRKKNMTDLMNRILDVRYDNLDLEREFCLQLEVMAREEGYTYGLAFAYVYLVDCYLSQNDSLICVTYLRQAQALCVENGFYELLLLLYNFAGIYYLRLGDEQTALMNYMEGLDLARSQGNVVAESNILSNIGLGFQDRGDYAAAKHYFRFAYEVMSPHATKDTIFRCVIFLCNLAEVSQFLGQLEDSRRYLELCHAIDTDAFNKNIRVCAGWCGHYSASREAASSLLYADKVLDFHLEEQDDKYFAIEIFQSMCRYMLNLKLKEYSRRFIDLLLGLKAEADLESAYKLQLFQIEYAELFLTKADQISLYKEFYVITKKMEELSNKVHADGMISRVLLMQALEEQARIQSQNVKLKDASYMDELTHLYNRRYFNKMVSKAYNRKDVTVLGIIMLDVDYFKQYNDCYGHNSGDEVLLSVAECMRGYPEEQICPGRYGGDEFVCLCINRTDGEVESYIRKVREDLRQKQIRHIGSKCENQVTLSIGYCNQSAETVRDVNLLLELADQALYEAKKRGRNCCCRNERMENECHA